MCIRDRRSTEVLGGCDAETSGGVHEKSDSLSGSETATLPDPRGCKTAADGAGQRTKDDTATTLSGQSGTSTECYSRTSTGGESTSTGDSCLTAACSAIKSEPSDEEPNDWSSRRESDGRCHDSTSDVIQSSRCEQWRTDDGDVHFTAGCPPPDVSRRPACPCGPLPRASCSPGDRAVTQGRRRRRSGLSRLRRTELRRRSRIAADDPAADSCDETPPPPAKKPRFDVGRAELRDVTSGESLRVENCVASNNALNNTTADCKPTSVAVHSITTETQPTSSSAASVSTATTARQSLETVRLAENEATDENRSVDVTHERKQTKTQPRAPVSTTEPPPAVHAVARATEIFPTVSTSSSSSSREVGRTTVHAEVVSPPTSDADAAVSPTNAVLRTPLAVPLTALLRPRPVLADFAAGAARSLVVAAPRCVVTRLRRGCGDMAGKRREVVTWTQVPAVSPVLRCALTALKCHTVALVGSPAYYVPRHIPIFYPRHRLLCYPPSPCV